jgi:putative transposase
LGEISNDTMLLNSSGGIVKSCWEEIPEHFTNAELSAYIIMPNHFHGIIVVDHPVEARHAVPVVESFRKPIGGSLPTIIRSFKSAVTKRINLSYPNRKFPLWQRGYYEHVVRSEEELVQIGDYILSNPMKWEVDRENPDPIVTAKPLPFEY